MELSFKQQHTGELLELYKSCSNTMWMLIFKVIYISNSRIQHLLTFRKMKNMKLHFRQQYFRGTLKLSNYYWITMQMSICRVMGLLLWNCMLTYIWAGGQYGSALQAAVYQGHLEIVKLLLDHNADVNLKGNGPISLELYAYLYLGRWRIWKCTSGSSISGEP
jgi:hypothetical protein